MAYRSYGKRSFDGNTTNEEKTPWTRSTGSSGTSSYYGGSTYMGIPKSSDTSTPASTDSKSTSSYTGRYGGTGSSTTGNTGSSYRSSATTGASSYRPYSSIGRSTERSSDRSTDRASDRSLDRTSDRSTAPSKYGSSTSSSYQTKEKDVKETKDSRDLDRPSIREKYHMGPALPSPPSSSTTTSARDTKDDKPSIRDKYGLSNTNKEDRQSLIDKYSTGTYPGRSTDSSRSYGSSSSITKEETPSSHSKSSLSRSTSARSEKSPEPEKTSSYSSLSPYRLYSRGSSTYSRSTSKDTDASSTATTPASTPVTTPTSLRFGSSRYLTRSPITDKPFSLSSMSSDKPRRPWSPRQATDDASTKDAATTSVTETTTTRAETPKVTESKDKNTSETKDEAEPKKKIEKVMVMVVTRGTSPTPPSSSAFLRTRRADLARVIEKTISRPVERPEMADKEVQSDRGDDTARHSRYGTTRSTASPWSSYLDRYSSTGAIGQTVSKYTTRTGGFSYPSARDREPSVTTSASSEPTPSASDTTKTSVTDSKPPIEPAKLSEKQTEKVAPDKKEDKLSATKTDTLKKSEPKVLERLRRTPSVAKLAEVLNENKSKLEETSLNKTKTTLADNTSDDKKTTISIKSDDSNKTTKPPDEPKVTGGLVKSLSVSKFGESPILKRRANLQSANSSSTTSTAATDSADKSVLDKKPPTKIQTDQNTSILNKTPSSQKVDSDTNVLNKSASTQKVDSTTILSKSPSVQKVDNTSLLSKSPSTQKIESNNILSKSPSVQKIDNTSLLSKSPSTQKIESTSILSKPPATQKTENSSISSKSPSEQKVENAQNKSPAPQKSDKDTTSDKKLTSVSKPPLGTKEVNSSTKDLTKIVSNDIKSKPSESLIKKEESASEKTEKSASNKTSKSKAESPSASETESSKVKSPSSKSLSTESESLTSPPTSPPSAAKPPLAKIGSPAANRKFLPPPVPKSDSHGNLKQSSTQSSLSKSVTNKDFRKSTLNMDIAPTDAEEVQRLQEKQRLTRKLESRTKRTTSTSSDKSEGSEATEQSESTDAKVASTALKQSKSLTNAKLLPTSSSKTNVLSVPSPSPKRHSPSRSSRSPSRSRRSASSSMDSSSSESETSTSSDEDESHSRSDLVNRRRRSSKSPSAVDKRKSAISVTSLAVSSADESSISEKPPRPPSSPKPPPKEEPKSFLMRALAPVTNLFRSKAPESLGSSNESVSEPLQRTGSTLSLNKASASDKEDSSSKKLGDELKNKIKIRHVESGERAWWMESNSNIPEGIQRIQSSKSISKISSDSEKESNKSSKKSVKDKNKANMIKRIESGERAWWLDSNSNIPEGVARNASSASINKNVTDSDKESKGSSENQKFKIKHVESGERAWWLESSSSIPDIKKMNSTHSIPEIREPSPQVEDSPRKFPIRHQDSGDKAWWLSSNSSIPEGIKKIASRSSLADVKEKRRSHKADSSESSEEESEISESEDETKKTAGVPKFPLDVKVTRPSPPPPAPSKPEESGRTSPYDNVKTKTPAKTKKRPKNQPLFIGSHTNIDDILGSAASLVNPVMGLSRLRGEVLDESADEEEECKKVDPKQVRVHDSTAQKPTIQHLRDAPEETKRRQSKEKLDDAALQLYKDGDYGSYLDLEASINEQQEEFEGFDTNRKNSIVLRTQLSVRVHTIIEKLLNSEGRELRRALFSLKQIFQEDKDLVHEFVQNDGLACLIKVGSEADQNYQNYILRALGQVMLYVDGMNGVMEHNRTVQWLYSLIASKFRLVVKTALKLLLVFVEYVETNCLLLIKAVHAVDTAQGCLPWSNIMKLIKDYDAADTELLIYATTLVNKTFNGVPDQDTYYDQVDALEEQGIEGAIQRYMSKQGTDLDLLRQFQIYEAVLHHEDGEEKGTPLRQLDESIRKTLRNRKSPAESLTAERRKSRRHSTGTEPLSASLNHSRVNHSTSVHDDEESGSSSSRSSPGPGELPHLNGSYKDKQTDDAGVTPALRRRRERAERQRSFIREQQETAANLRASLGLSPDGADDDNDKLAQRLNNGSCDSNKLSRASSRKDLTPLMNAVNKIDSAENELDDKEETPEMKVLLQMKRENTVKDLTQKLSNQNILHSPVEEKMNRIGDMSGLISKAKEGLAKSKSKDLIKSSSGDVPKLMEIKKSETELHWEELVNNMKRPLEVCDLDFTDLKSDDEVDVLSPMNIANGIPPPPPPAPISSAIPPPRDAPPPPPPNRLSSFITPPPPRQQKSPEKNSTSPVPKKTKKTVKLFWKEVRDDPIAIARLQKTGMIWDELQPIPVDTQKLEHLFESRAKDLITKKQQELNKNKEIIVLDHKRSNAINIGMTKLPPPRSIKTAILKMDATIMNREGIEKLLTMLPTEDERSKIQEAQVANPEIPLGSAEQFLLTLASISELPARLKLWAFKLDYENSEKEIADPLMDLKQGIETLKVNKTFRCILSTLLSIGMFLNGTEVKGFQIEYLAKVPEVKDTVHKHSLLHHLSHMVMEKFPEATDLYSEIGAITRASKVDFDELAANIVKMEQECKASWDHLKLIAKHDGSTTMKVKMSDFLADCAERIIVLSIVHRRVMNRYHLFLLWLGVPLHRVQDMKPNEFCRIVSEFSLEYRTTRERVLQTLEKKANHRERNKTRGKMITEVGKFRTKEDRADAELRQLLGSDLSDAESVVHGSLTWRRQRKDMNRTVLSPIGREESVNGNLTDGDDEILESLVKTATKAPGTRTTPRERKRTRQADRKSLKRSRTRENHVEGEGSASP